MQSYLYLRHYSFERYRELLWSYLGVWDIALHATSGRLIGIVGFLLNHVLNESECVAVHMRPRFVALFACLLAIAVGALWEGFEFSKDQIVGTNIQKPMVGDTSGLTDTMWNMIVIIFARHLYQRSRLVLYGPSAAVIH